MSEENHAVEAGGDRTLINPSSAGDIRNGMVAILKGNPCKVAEVRTSKTGKHGHAKCNITGVCIMTGRKFVEMLPSHVAVDIAMVKKIEYQLLDISGETATLMTMDDSGETIDIDCNGEEGQKLKEQYTGDDTQDTVVTVQTAPVMINQNYVNQSMIIGFKKVDHV